MYYLVTVVVQCCFSLKSAILCPDAVLKDHPGHLPLSANAERFGTYNARGNRTEKNLHI